MEGGVERGKGAGDGGAAKRSLSLLREQGAKGGAMKGAEVDRLQRLCQQSALHRLSEGKGGAPLRLERPLQLAVSGREAKGEETACTSLQGGAARNGSGVRRPS